MLLISLSSFVIADSFASSLEPTKDHITREMPPQNSISPGFSATKRPRPDSSDEPYPPARKHCGDARKFPPFTSSPFSRPNGLQTPNLSIDRAGESDIPLKKHDHGSNGHEACAFRDAEVGSNGLEAEIRSLAVQIEDFDDDLFNDMEFDDEERIEDQRPPGEIETENLASLVDWDLDDNVFEDILENCPKEEALVPPSSVMRAHDCESRSAGEYDPNLQHSSPSTTSSATLLCKDETPLEQDIDWALVHEYVQKDEDEAAKCSETQVGDTGQKLAPETKATWTEPQGSNTTASTVLLSSRMLMKPHKTFFHIQEMLDAKKQLFKHQPDVVFELFARVAYSSRENFIRKQYFQFRSLFKESPPYINGILTG